MHHVILEFLMVNPILAQYIARIAVMGELAQVAIPAQILRPRRLRSDTVVFRQWIGAFLAIGFWLICHWLIFPPRCLRSGLCFSTHIFTLLWKALLSPFILQGLPSVASYYKGKSYTVCNFWRGVVCSNLRRDKGMEL